MESSEFESEFAAILDILRQHSYMRYSNDQAAWESRVRTVAEAYLSLVRRKTGLPLHAEPEQIPIDDIRGPSRENARHLASRIARRYKRLAERYPPESHEHGVHLHAGQLWEQASRMI